MEAILLNCFSRSCLIPFPKQEIQLQLEMVRFDEASLTAYAGSNVSTEIVVGILGFICNLQRSARSCVHLQMLFGPRIFTRNHLCEATADHTENQQLMN